MKLSRYEQETIINFNEEEPTAGVYTHNQKLCEKLERMAHKRPEKIKLERHGPHGAVSFTKGRRWNRPHGFPMASGRKNN